MKSDDFRPAHILVLYHSQDGHTKMMADLVVEGATSVPTTEVRLKSVAEATADDLVWCDGVAVGSPTHMGTIAWEMKRWWDVTVQPLWPKVEGKIGCAFTSSGGLAGGGELTCLALQVVLMNYGLLVFGIPDYVAPGQTLHYGAICAGRPRNDGEREACRRLGRRLSEWVQTFICHRPEHDPRKATYARFTNSAGVELRLAKPGDAGDACSPRSGKWRKTRVNHIVLDSLFPTKILQKTSCTGASL